MMKIRFGGTGRSCRAMVWGLVLLALSSATVAQAQAPQIPGFWDPQKRIEKPDVPAPRVIRFITEDDYPPFNFALPDGSLTGFNVELARAICEELKTPCTIQPRRWDTLVPALTENRADAAIASIVSTPDMRRDLDFTAPYYRTPGRFVTRRGDVLPEPVPENMGARKVGSVAGSAHEAFLRARFASADLMTFENAGALRAALREGEIDYLFGDGVSLAIWLNGTQAAGCCAFAGGPYLDEAYFGEGIGIALRKGNNDLRRLFDYALKRLWERGVYADLYLRFFPVGFF